MLILGIDFETTGLDIVNDRIIEYGCVLYDTSINQPVSINGNLIAPDILFTESKWSEITKITKITNKMVGKHGITETFALNQIKNVIYDADTIIDAFCAFNGNKFDKFIYQNLCKRQASMYDEWIPWIDPRIDCINPPTSNQTMWAAENGFVNPFPHRAVTDVLTMFKCITASNESLEAMYERAKIPCISVFAINLPYDRRSEASSRGFYWVPASKAWMKDIKEDVFEKLKSELPFKIQRV